MKRVRFLALAACLTLLTLGAPQAHAQSWEHKLARGAAGMIGGVVELPGNIYYETKRNGAAGLPKGIALGLGMIVARELVGVYEFLTAPFPLPAGYQPILQPEYPWGYF